MTYSVLVEENSDHGFRATALGFPECRTVAQTREQALLELQSLLAERLSKAEIVEVELPQQTRNEHTWKKFAGMFHDQSLFDETIEAIEVHRRENEV